MVVNVTEVIEKERVGLLQIRVLVLTMLAIIVDGFDIQAIAFAGPVLLAEWGLAKADLAPAIAAALVGMALGAPLGGIVGDKLGRRMAIVASAAFFGVATIATSRAPDITSLTILRLISGLGFGAMLPNATALLAEWMPARLRSHAVSLMIIGVPLGGMIGAAVSRWLIPDYGWRSIFAFGGVLGLVVGVLLLLLLPESLRFLMNRGDDSTRAERLLTKAFPARNFTGSTFTVDSAATKASWRDVFTRNHVRVSLGLSLAFFSGLMVFYCFSNWVPTVLTSMGMPLDVAIRGAFYFNMWSLAGAIGGGLLIAWRGSRTGLLLILGCALAVTVVMAYLILTGRPSELAVMIGLSCAGASASGLQAALYGLAAAAYPTNCRSTGVGLVAGVGRLGSITSAFAGGVVLSLPGGNGLFFVLVAGVLVVASLGILIVDRHSPPTMG